MYLQGEIVYDETDRDSKGQPTYKKLWIWESKYDPVYPPKSGWVYTLRDGPGEKANFVGWAREADLSEDFPKEEESLIDL